MSQSIPKGKYILRIEDEFEAAHFLLNHPGKCARLHGHAWKVEAVVEGDTLDQIGCLVDFSHLKKALAGACETLDHRLLNELPPFTQENPSAENLAAYLYGQVKAGLGHFPQVNLREVTVWESARASATYQER